MTDEAYKHKMTVKELVAALLKYDQDLPVVFSKDEEGNWFHHNALVTQDDISLDDEHREPAVFIYPLNGEYDFQ